MEFKITVNVAEIAERLGKVREEVEKELVPILKRVSYATKDFILDKAKRELTGFKRDLYTAADPSTGESKHVRWTQVSEGLYVVDIDPVINWIENGRPPTSMATEDWLLKPGKAKRAKDGSLYRAIPFTHQATGEKGAALTKVGGSEALKSLLRKGLEEAVKRGELPKEILKTGKRGIIKDEHGKPKLGLVARLNIEDPGKQVAGFHSKPRTAQEAALTGFKEHEGIFYLKGAAIFQRKNEKGKITREILTFRTVSSKHQIEGRWMYPAVQPFNGIEAGYQWAQKEMDKAIREFELSMGK